MYKYIHTCIYIHIYMSAHIHTYAYIHTHIQNVHMNARKHAWNDGTAANAREAVVERGSFALSFVRRNQNTFRTSNARTSLYPPPETPILLHSPFPLPNIPQNTSRTAGKRFTMAPCVVVERLEGKQRCSRAAVGSTQESKPENDQGDCSRETKGQ